MLIRSITPADYDAVKRLTIDAFTNCSFGHNGEADLVERLRGSCDGLRELVASDDDVVVGHILFSPVSVRTENGVVDGMGLAPMSVAPDHQRAGIGTALVESGIQQLVRVGCRFVVVLGWPDYYSRFGFQLGSKYQLSHGFEDIPQEVFFVNLLQPNVAQSIAGGTAIYRREFGPQSC